MEKKRILITDDEQELSAIIREMLEGCGYLADTAANADEAFSLLRDKKYDLVILDINLPDEDGFEICREIRRVSQVPLIFASARSTENDRIKGFDTGGDDFLPKPYSMRELLSRVNALMRRACGGTERTIYSFGSIKVDTAARTVTKQGKNISLAQREFDLLEYLCKNMNTAVSKEKLLADVWGAFSEVEPSTLTVHIRWLREKLEEDPAAPEYIKTVWRLGYMLEDGQ